MTQQVKRTSDSENPILTISAKNGWMDQKDRFNRVIAGKELKNYIELYKNELSYNHGNSKYAKFGIIYVQRKYEKALVPKVYHSFSMSYGDPRFIENLSLGHKLDKELSKFITSGARQDGLLNINKKSFYAIKLFIPSEQEQIKISNIMDVINHIITLYERKLKLVKLICKELENKVYNNDLIKQTNFTKVKLGEILKEKNIKSTYEDQYPVLSSTNSGIELRNGRTNSSSNVGYKVLSKNELVLSPQNLWLGNININFDFENGLVSPSYKVFILTNNINIIYLNSLLHHPKMMYLYKVVSVQGASIVRRNLDIEAFENLTLKVPSIEAQNKIGNLLGKNRQLIDNLENKKEQISKIKTTLLNTMFI